MIQLIFALLLGNASASTLQILNSLNKYLEQCQTLHDEQSQWVRKISRLEKESQGYFGYFEENRDMVFTALKYQLLDTIFTPEEILLLTQNCKSKTQQQYFQTPFLHSVYQELRYLCLHEKLTNKFNAVTDKIVLFKLVNPPDFVRRCWPNFVQRRTCLFPDIIKKDVEKCLFGS